MSPIIISGIILIIIIIIIYFVQKRPAKLYALSVAGFNNDVSLQGLLTINNNNVVAIPFISPIPPNARIWQLDPTNKVIYAKTSNGTFAISQTVYGAYTLTINPYTPGGSTNNIVIFDKGSDGKNYLYLVEKGEKQNWCVMAGLPNESAQYSKCYNPAQLL